jgi:hypothetical protein
VVCHLSSALRRGPVSVLHPYTCAGNVDQRGGGPRPCETRMPRALLLACTSASWAMASIHSFVQDGGLFLVPRLLFVLHPPLFSPSSSAPSGIAGWCFQTCEREQVRFLPPRHASLLGSFWLCLSAQRVIQPLRQHTATDSPHGCRTSPTCFCSSFGRPCRAVCSMISVHSSVRMWDGVCIRLSTGQRVFPQATGALLSVPCSSSDEVWFPCWVSNVQKADLLVSFFSSEGGQSTTSGESRLTTRSRASRHCFITCYLSMTCCAAGAPSCAPRAYSPARSRLIHVTPGWARSHFAKVSAVRSGRRSPRR